MNWPFSRSLQDGATLPVAAAEQGDGDRVQLVPPSIRNLSLRVIEKTSRKPVAVKLHVHGESGEHLAPADRNRIPNTFWYEDWSIDYIAPNAQDRRIVPSN